jgi:hypothetical protein
MGLFNQNKVRVEEFRDRFYDCDIFHAVVNKYLTLVILVASAAVMALFLVIFTSPVQALMLKFSLPELVNGADAIIVGSVTGRSSQWNTDRSHIETIVTLSVEEYLKGTSSEGNLTINVPGGEVAGITERVSDTPGFDQGERVVLFLKNLNNRIEVFGSYQGKCRIEEGQAGFQYLDQIKEDIKQALAGTYVPPQTDMQLAEPSPLDLTQITDIAPNSSPQSSILAAGWQTITSMDFEPGSGAGWLVSGNPTWGSTTYKSYAGSYSGWCARGGTLGIDPATNNYSNNMNAWLVYGPFDLSDASFADLSFYRWLRSETSCDYFKVLASVDGSNFHSYRYSGILDSWEQYLVDLRTWPTLGNLCGRSQVWIAFKFDSNASTTDKGAFLDNIILRKYVSATKISQISPSSASAGTNTQVTITGSGFGTVPGTVNFFYQDGEPGITGTTGPWSDTSIVTTVPAEDISQGSVSTSSGPVYVHTVSGDSPPVPFTVTFSFGGVKWLGTNPVVDFRVNPNTADCTGELTAVQTAASTWNAVPSKNFTFNYAGASSATQSSHNGVNEILWKDLGSTGPLAQAIRWTTSNNIDETDIEFNDYFNWSSAASPLSGQYDVQSAALHEMGHWLRLRDLYGNISGYPQDGNKVMYGFGSPGTTKKTLDATDIAGIQWIYPPAATRLAFTTQPAGAVAGVPFTTQPVVTIQDANGNTVTASTASVTLAITSGTGASGAVLSGTKTVSTVNGVATFSGLSIDKAGTGYTLTASSSGLTSDTSNVFNVVAGTATRLAFTTPPAGAVAGVPFTTQPVVTIQDANGNTVTASTASVTLAITSGTGISGAVLSGTKTVSAVNGVAAFGGLSIDKVGTRYTLTASSDSLTSATSRAFNVTTVPEAEVNISVGLQGSSRPYSGWVVPLTIKLFTSGNTTNPVDILTATPVHTFALITTQNGNTAIAQATGVIPGTYDITLASEHCLCTVKRSVVIGATTVDINMGTLPEGDANGSHVINIQDFGILAATYGKSTGVSGYDSRADFDRNGIINIADFGLLAANYGKHCPVEIP